MQTLRATRRAVSLRVDDAISALLSIFEIVTVSFTLPFFTMRPLYDLTARRSIGCPSALVNWRSLESLLTLYCGLWQKERLYKYTCSSEKGLFDKSQEDDGKSKTRAPRRF